MKVTFEGDIHEILTQIEHFTKSIITAWSEPVKVEQKPAKKVKVVQPEPPHYTPCQAHAVEQEKVEQVPISPTELEPAPEDLLGAVMALVNGDKEKKVRLVEILGMYDAKTIGALAPEYRAEFWLQAQDLGGE